MIIGRCWPVVGFLCGLLRLGFTVIIMCLGCLIDQIIHQQKRSSPKGNCQVIVIMF